MCNGKNFKNKLLQYYHPNNIFVTLNSNTPTVADFIAGYSSLNLTIFYNSRFTSYGHANFAQKLDIKLT